MPGRRIPPWLQALLAWICLYALAFVGLVAWKLSLLSEKTDPTVLAPPSAPLATKAPRPPVAERREQRKLARQEQRRQARKQQQQQEKFAQRQEKVRHILTLRQARDARTRAAQDLLQQAGQVQLVALQEAQSAHETARQETWQQIQALDDLLQSINTARQDLAAASQLPDPSTTTDSRIHHLLTKQFLSPTHWTEAYLDDDLSVWDGITPPQNALTHVHQLLSASHWNQLVPGPEDGWVAGPDQDLSEGQQGRQPSVTTPAQRVLTRALQELQPYSSSTEETTLDWMTLHTLFRQVAHITRDPIFRPHATCPAPRASKTTTSVLVQRYLEPDPEAQDEDDEEGRYDLYPLSVYLQERRQDVLEHIEAQRNGETSGGLPLAFEETVESLQEHLDQLLEEAMTFWNEYLEEWQQAVAAQAAVHGHRRPAPSDQARRGRHARPSSAPDDDGVCIQSPQVVPWVRAGLDALYRRRDVRDALLRAMAQDGLATQHIILDASLPLSPSPPLNRTRAPMSWRQALDAPVWQTTVPQGLNLLIESIAGYHEVVDRFLDSFTPPDGDLGREWVRLGLEAAGPWSVPAVPPGWVEWRRRAGILFPNSPLLSWLN